MRETTGDKGRPRKVAYLITSSGMGGAEQQVCHLARAFRRRGWEVAAVSMLPLESPIADLSADGIRTVSLEMRRGSPDPRAVAALGRFVRGWRPDVLHAHMVHANLLARLTRLVSPIPRVVSTMHSQDEGAQWRYVAYRVTNRLSDATTAVSRVAAAEAIRRHAAPARSMQVVPNGIATEAYARDAVVRRRLRDDLGVGDRFTWLAAGRLVDAKGYLDMLAAFASLRRRHPDAQLLIAGSGPLEAEMRAAATRAGLGDGLRILGFRPDVPALMQAADGFVMSSRWEGLPMVLLEAGASSLPIVATDVGGSRDAILEGVSGYMTPARDPEGLAEAMARVMDLDGAERGVMGSAGREHIVGTFDIETVADRWEAIYVPGPTATG